MSGYSHTNSKGTNYYLNTKEVSLRGDRKYPIYFFSKDQRDTACELPEGKMVVENKRTGMPLVKNRK